MKLFYGFVFWDENIDGNEKSFPSFEVRGNDVESPPDFGACTVIT